MAHVQTNTRLSLPLPLGYPWPQNVDKLKVTWNGRTQGTLETRSEGAYSMKAHGSIRIWRHNNMQTIGAAMK